MTIGYWKRMFPCAPAAALALALSVPAAQAGHGDGSHGGDTLVEEFTLSASSLVKVLHDRPGLCPGQSELAAIIPLTRVDSSPLVLISGVEHDARNYFDDDAKPRIEISRSRFLEIADSRLYMKLLIHEYYGLLRSPDGEPRFEGTNDFHVSRACVDSIEEAGVNLKDLYRKLPLITSMERLFVAGDGRFEFQCKSGDLDIKVYTEHSPSLRARLGRTHSPYLAGDFYQIAVDRELRGKFVRIAGLRDTHVGPEDVLRKFSTEYSISEGVGRTLFSADLQPSMRLQLSTVDRATWKLRLVPQSDDSSPLEATCSPASVTRYDVKYEGAH